MINVKGKEVNTVLKTSVTFIKGSCDNKVNCEDSKPMIYHFKKPSKDYQDIHLMAFVLKECFRRREDDVVIMCNNKYEVFLVEEALPLIGMEVILYIPYLQNRLPTSEEKQNILRKRGSKSIVLSDYRSYRGCEASHSIIVTDFNKPVGANIMVEMISRTIAYLDIIVRPKMEESSYANPVESELAQWNKDGLVEKITVEVVESEVEKDDEIQFNLYNSLNNESKTESLEIKQGKLLSSFDEQPSSNETYL